MEEALNINLSLHFLENVIIALNRKELHIPYRNSMMTMCLRDSLGGNCKTRMIATLSADFDDVHESMSTCRFAQRVALVKNVAVKNEIEDHNVVIQKQKYQIEELKSELAIIKGKDQKCVLDKEDIVNCRKIVEEYLSDDDYNRKINLNDMLMIHECFSQIKIMYKDLEKKVGSKEVIIDGQENKDKIIELENMNKKLSSEIDNLRGIIKKNDEEMKVLLNALDKHKQEDNKKTLLSRLNEEDDTKLTNIKNNILGNIIKFEKPTIESSNITGVSSLIKSNIKESSNINESSVNTIKSAPLNLLKDINTANSYLVEDIEISKELIADMQQAYIQFRKFYIKAELKEENKKLVKEKYDEGKALGEELNKIKENVQSLKINV